jgi:hypothetical protein
MTQKAAVFAAMCNVFEVESFDARVEPTKEQRATVNQILFEGFRAGRIELDREYDDSGLKAYVSGLQSNWLRKDKRLNGNVTYVAKNPGSRAGSKDPQITAMRLLLQTKSDPADRAEIQKFIDARVAEIKPTKSVELTTEQIESLKSLGLGHLVG